VSQSHGIHHNRTSHHVIGDDAGRRTTCEAR
jgi:hypothetical protein